jgi:hypothetical protein
MTTERRIITTHSIGGEQQWDAETGKPIDSLDETVGQLAGPSEAFDHETGTKRLFLYRESAEGGTYGDDARGYALVSRYISDDGSAGRCGELAVYPELLTPTGIDDDGLETYGVTEQWICGGVELEEDGTPRPDDQSEVVYEEIGARIYTTLADAQREADRIGRSDWSFAIYLRKRNNDTKED